MLFEPFGAPGNTPKLEPQHHFRRRKHYFLAFGCDFEGKKCLEQRKTRGFEVSGKAKTLYFASEIAVFFLQILSAKWAKKREFHEKSGAGIRKT